MDYIGSTWRKCDFHVHSPSSYDYEDKSVTNEEIIDILVSNDIGIAAITDHHLIDVERIHDLQKIGAGKISILPGIEFRSELGGSESIHFIGIFSENCNLEDIWTHIQSQCKLTTSDISKQGGDEKIHCDLKETSSLIHDLGGIVSVHAGAKSNSLEKITNALTYKMAQKTDLVLNHIDILEIGKPEDQEAYRDIVFPKIDENLPMIICSDNHNIRDYSVKENLWIKGDQTFEGFKQILFEPLHRVFIGEDHPIKPPLRINKVNFDFPENSTFENEVFCLSGKKVLMFSPNFTCLIGGRGTGKSTILNLIHEKLRPNENIFFKDKKILDSSSDIVSIENSVKIDDDADEKYIEFLSQNEVEDFASDYQKLTKAVYSRIIKRDEEGILIQYEQSLINQIGILNAHIDNKIELIRLENELNRKQKELGANIKIVESFSSDEYKTINDNLKRITRRIQNIEISKEEYKEVISYIQEIINAYSQDSIDNLYSDQVNKIIESLVKLIEESDNKDYSSIESEYSKLLDDLKAKKAELLKYLASKGLTEENQKDISVASLLTAKIEKIIARHHEEINLQERVIDEFNIDIIEESSNTYKEELLSQISSISEILEKPENTTIRPISLQFEFDYETAHYEIFLDFKNVFTDQIEHCKHKGDSILMEILFSIAPKDVSTQDKLIEEISNNPSTSAAKPFLIELFNQNTNFDLYKLIISKHLLNHSEYKKIKVYYDTRPIEKSSFGQRCTAVIVILLLLGNNPIIIDEPEAHLDSLLISNYLVNLIKERKNSRQIIFATHNANFVINGDADLIHILNIDEDNKITEIASTTIENTNTREALISLEGGKEAFLQREYRYQIFQ